MAKDPAFLFYPSDFMIGTALFTHEQRGKYISLLCYQHQLGPLSKDDMLSVCGSEDKRVFNKFIINDEGKYFNERLERERLKRNRYTESRINNLKSHKASHMESHMENRNRNVNENEIRKENKYKVKYFIKPSVEEIKQYCEDRKNGIDPQKFFDSNEAKGWVVGTTKTPMKDWKAAIRTWESNRDDIKKSEPKKRYL